MKPPSVPPPQHFDRLREHSIGLPEVLFQSITHMAPAAAVAFSILVSVGFAGQALPLAVLLAMIACVLVANSIGQLAKHMPSAGGLYTYNARAYGPKAGPYVGFMTGWIFLLFEPLVAPLLFLIFAWATDDVVKNEIGWDIGWAWWVLVAAGIVFFLTYRDVRLSTRAGVVLGVIEITIFAGLAIWMLISNAGSLDLQAFNPENKNPDASSDFSGIFKGMIFGILAFIGFEAAAPLGEEARHARWTIPRAVVLSAFLIVLFYIAVCLGSIYYYWTRRRAEFNALLHLVFPLLGAAAFAFPLYYQFKDWPDNPLGYGNWIAIGWIGAGLIITAYLAATRPQALRNSD